MWWPWALWPSVARIPPVVQLHCLNWILHGDSSKIFTPKDVGRAARQHDSDGSTVPIMWGNHDLMLLTPAYSIKVHPSSKHHILVTSTLSSIHFYQHLKLILVWWQDKDTKNSCLNIFVLNQISVWIQLGQTVVQTWHKNASYTPSLFNKNGGLEKYSL